MTVPTRPAAATGRSVPHDLVAEESLLGALLLNRQAITDCIEVCSADDFHKPAHAHIYAAIRSLDGRGEPVDPVTVADELRRNGLLEAAGGPAAIVALQATTPATGNARRYAVIVEELSRLRRLIGAGVEIAELGYGVPDDVDAAVDQAEHLVFDIAQRRLADTMLPASDVVSGVLDRIEILTNRGDAITGVPTGFVDLDHRLCGLQPSNLIIVGARPAMGKTALALNIAANVAIDQARPAVVFSFEMSQYEVGSRLLSADGRIDSTRMRTGRFLESDWPKLAQAAARVGGAPLHVDDNPLATVTDIRAKARRLKARYGDLGLVVVDYIQLMIGRRSAENRQVEVAEISRALKLLARELDCPVLALSQLSRNLETRADKRPTLADLKESGSLEQDADVVLLMYRDELYNKESQDRGMAEINIAKHRSGPTGVVRLAYLDTWTRFANMAAV